MRALGNVSARVGGVRCVVRLRLIRKLISVRHFPLYVLCIDLNTLAVGNEPGRTRVDLELNRS
jgi:hypothetical protein